MKKRFFTVALVVAVMALGLTSCEDKNTEKCWETKTTSEILGAEVSVTGYAWGTQAQMEAAKANAEAVPGVTFTFSKSSEKTADDCAARNIK